MWTLKVIMSNFSCRSCPLKPVLFSVMFSDSEIAKEFSLGKTKVSYTICCGITPYFRDMFIGSSKEVQMYNLSFDESYCNVLTKRTNEFTC